VLVQELNKKVLALTLAGQQARLANQVQTGGTTSSAKAPRLGRVPKTIAFSSRLEQGVGGLRTGSTLGRTSAPPLPPLLPATDEPVLTEAEDVGDDDPLDEVKLAQPADDRRSVPLTGVRVTADGRYVLRERSALGVCLKVAGVGGTGTWVQWLAKRKWNARNQNEASAICNSLDCFIREGADPATSDGMETLVCRFLALEALESGHPTSFVNALLWSPQEDTLLPRSLARDARHEAILVGKLDQQKKGGSGANSKKKGGYGGKKQAGATNENKERAGKKSGAPVS